MAEPLSVLSEQRKHVVLTLKDIRDKVRSEGDRNLTAAEFAQIEELNGKVKEYDGLIAERKKTEDVLNAIETVDPVKTAATLSPDEVRNVIPPGTIRQANYPRTFHRVAKLKAFENSREGEEKAYRCGQWLWGFLGNSRARRWCDANDVECRALNESVNADGGALVPDELVAAIIDLRENYGVFRRYARTYPMMSDVLSVPRQTGGLTTYFPSEGGTLTTSDSQFDQVKLVAKKLAAAAKVSSELEEDSIINIVDRFAVDVAKAFGQTEDQCGFLGDGTATYGGMVGVNVQILDVDGAGTNSAGAVAAATAAHDTFGEIDITDLSGVLAKVPEYAMMGDPAWYCSQTAWALVFQRLAVSQGGATAAEAVAGVQKQFLGYPVRISQVMPSGAATDYTGAVMLLFGDLSMACAFGDRRSVRLQRANELYAATDQIGLFATERIDINVHDVGSSATAGPICALLGGSG